MPTIRTLEVISRIGEDLVHCNRSCGGIVCSRHSGQIPRCLFLENGASHKPGAVVVGLNPGRASKAERLHYRKEGCTYDAVVEWFEIKGNKHGQDHPYYKRLREFLRMLKLEGPILWTELAKCESAPAFKSIPLQTFRTCSGAFLQRELEIPQVQKWPLFAVGAEAYKGVAYRFPERTVIGVPHPTGSRGHYAALFTKRTVRGKELRSPKSNIIKAVRETLNKPGKSAWLGIQSPA